MFLAMLRIVLICTDDLWKSENDSLEDDGNTRIQLFSYPFKFQCSCTASLKVIEGTDYIPANGTSI
jgi:hypothetical protein